MWKLFLDLRQKKKKDFLLFLRIIFKKIKKYQQWATLLYTG